MFIKRYKPHIGCKIANIALILLMLYTISVGCAKSLPEITVQNISKYKTFQNKNGVSIAIDPFIEEKRLDAFFGTDLLSDFGILPVHIIIENNINQPILIEGENILLVDAKNKVIQKLSVYSAPVEKREAEKGFVIGLLVGTIVQSIYMQSVMQSENIESNLKIKALYDKSIYNKLESHHGFVYLVLEDSSILDNTMLQVKVKNIKTESLIAFDFNIAHLKEEAKRRKKEAKNE